MNASSPTFSLVLMILLIALIYFMMIRPQRKKDKADREMRENMKVGDEAITIGGIVGKIEELECDYLDVAATVIEHRLGLSE